MTRSTGRVNCISHLLSMIPYEETRHEKIKLPPRQENRGYIRPPLADQTFVPSVV